MKQRFQFHTAPAPAPARAVAWKDNETFASCLVEKSVLIFRQVGPDEPYTGGHNDEINAVKWAL